MQLLTGFAIITTSISPSTASMTYASSTWLGSEITFSVRCQSSTTKT